MNGNIRYNINPVHEQGYVPGNCTVGVRVENQYNDLTDVRFNGHINRAYLNDSSGAMIAIIGDKANSQGLVDNGDNGAPWLNSGSGVVAEAGSPLIFNSTLWAGLQVTPENPNNNDPVDRYVQFTLPSPSTQDPVAMARRDLDQQSWNTYENNGHYCTLSKWYGGNGFWENKKEEVCLIYAAGLHLGPISQSDNLNSGMMFSVSWTARLQGWSSNTCVGVMRHFDVGIMSGNRQFG